MSDVCAVIVTYNRAELLCRCVSHLLAQEYPLDILIYDNHSSCDTESILAKEDLLQSNVTYYYAEQNTGGSGGFYHGMKMAMEKGYKYLWLMDDDGYAINEKTLSSLMENITKMKSPDFILNSLVVQDEQAQKVSFAVQRKYQVDQLVSENGLIVGEIMPFNGTLVSASLIQKIGYPLKEFFVYGDENEYYLRAKKAGADMAIDIHSHYYHPTNVANVKKVLGKNIYYMKMPLWKTYCAARNKMFIAKKYNGFSGCVTHALRSYIYIIIIPGKRWGRFVTTLRGQSDALRGKFDRPLDFSK